MRARCNHNVIRPLRREHVIDVLGGHGAVSFDGGAIAVCLLGKPRRDRPVLLPVRQRSIGTHVPAHMPLAFIDDELMALRRRHAGKFETGWARADDEHPL